MVLNDQSIKIQSRVRSALGRLRTSKSSLSLASLIKPEWIPPVPSPVLELPISLSTASNESEVDDDFWDRKSTAPVLLKRSTKKLSKRPAHRQKAQADPSQLPVLDQLLLQQGLLHSPISIHLATLLAGSSESLASSSKTTRRRSSSDSFLCLSSSVPFPPELVIKHVGKSRSPELSATLLNVPEPQSCLVATSGTLPNSPNASLRAVKLGASPAHRCLKRRGLIPSNQPLSSQLLQSVVNSPSDVGSDSATLNPSHPPALSAAICIWSDECDSAFRPQKPMTRQPLAPMDQNLLSPLSGYGSKFTTKS